MIFQTSKKTDSTSASPHSPLRNYTISGSSGKHLPQLPEVPEIPKLAQAGSPQKSGDELPAAIPVNLRRLINVLRDSPAVSRQPALLHGIGISNFRKLRGMYAEIAGSCHIISARSSNRLAILSAYPIGVSHAKTPNAFCKRSCRGFKNRRALSS